MTLGAILEELVYQRGYYPHPAKDRRLSADRRAQAETLGEADIEGDAGPSFAQLQDAPGPVFDVVSVRAALEADDFPLAARQLLARSSNAPDVAAWLVAILAEVESEREGRID